jgi:hypothetical protein
MALGNAYPAIQLDERGQAVDSGVVVQFMDSTDQPGAGGGGSSPVAATIQLRGPLQFGDQSAAAYIIGGDSFAGVLFASGSYPNLVGAMGAVVRLGAISYALAGAVASTEDDFDITLSVLVTDSLGTNVASASVLTQLPSPVTDLASTGTLSGQTWDVTTGADLTASGDTLSSTAGGNFFVFLLVSCGWD